jgi:hypothetical protein
MKLVLCLLEKGASELEEDSGEHTTETLNDSAEEARED